MKKWTFILAAVVLSAAIAALTGWYYFYGPGLDARVKQAAKNISAGERAIASADKALKAAAAAPDRWQALTIDAAAEKALIMEDLEANRQYKVDSFRNPSIAAIAEDIDDTGKRLAAAEKELKTALDDLESSGNTYLTAKADKDVAAGVERVDKTLNQVQRARAGLKELKSDNYVWGHMAAAVEAANSAMGKLELADAAMNGGDYTAVKERAFEADADNQVCAEWTMLAKQELINIGLYSEDTSLLMELVGQLQSTSDCYDQAALFMFGPRADAESFAQAKSRAGEEIKDRRRQAAALGISSDYKAWFLARAKEYLSA